MIEDMTTRKFAPKTQHDRAIEAMKVQWQVTARKHPARRAFSVRR
jgi:hypothetical protein